jgi:hypothetical protein
MVVGNTGNPRRNCFSVVSGPLLLYLVFPPSLTEEIKQYTLHFHDGSLIGCPLLAGFDLFFFILLHYKINS